MKSATNPTDENPTAGSPGILLGVDADQEEPNLSNSVDEFGDKDSDVKNVILKKGKAFKVVKARLRTGLHFGQRAGSDLWIPSRRHFNELADVIWDYRDVQGTYTVLASKGGIGKTTLIGYLAALRAMFNLGHMTLVIDTNENEGSTAYRLGVQQGESVLLPEVLANLEYYSAHANLSRALGYHTESGLAVLPNVDFIAQDDQARRHSLEKGMIVTRAVAHDVFCDSGNGIRHYTNIVPACVADVVLLPVLANDEETFDRIESLMKFLERSDPELGSTLRRKAFVVVLGAKPKHVAGYAESIGWPVDRTFVVPYDHHMATRARGNIQIHKLRMGTKIALMQLLVAMLRHERSQALSSLADLHELSDLTQSATSISPSSS